jgi:solute carrier family 35 protein F5
MVGLEDVRLGDDAQRGTVAMLLGDAADAPTPANKAASAAAAARWATGVVCIVIVALIWSFASVLVQYIFLDRDFYRPFFLTYVANSLFVINLPLWRLAVWAGVSTDPHAPAAGFDALSGRVTTEHAEADGPVEADGGAGTEPNRTFRSDEHADSADATSREPRGAWLRLVRSGRRAGDRIAAWTETGALRPGPGAREQARVAADCAPVPSPPGRVPYAAVLRISLLICPIWFGANLSYITSLALTSVTSSTIISTTSSLFTFVLSLCLLSERSSTAKVAGVALCMAGNVLTALADREAGGAHSARAFLGDVVCLLGAVLYGVYTVLIRRLMADEARYSLALFFGLLGCANALALGPLVYALHAWGIEPLESLTWELMGMIVVKGLLDNVLSDFLWAKAIVLTSPTAATVGLSLTIPIAMATDALLHGMRPSALGAVAALLVCGGFVLINVAGASEGCAEGIAEACLRRVRAWRRGEGPSRPSPRRHEPLYAVVTPRSGAAGAGHSIVTGR